MNSYSWPTDRSLTGTTKPVQSESGSNVNKEVKFPKSTWTGASPLDTVLNHTQDGGSLPLCWDVVDIFYSPSRHYL